MPQVAYDQLHCTLYGRYFIDNQYELAEGAFALPVAEEPPSDPVELASWSPVAVVRAHSPYRVRRVKMDVQKAQAPPVLPKPADTGAFTFLGGTLSMPVPRQGKDFKNFDWSAKAEYVFVENCVARPEDGLILGMQPWAYTSQDENAESHLTGTSTVYEPGAIGSGGFDAKTGYLQANTVDFTKPYWYSTPSYYPPRFWNGEVLNGGPPAGLNPFAGG